MERSPFDLSCGFLPNVDPIEKLPNAFHAWESLALELPKLLTTDHARETIEALPPFDTPSLTSLAEFERAMLLLSYLGHAYVWGQSNPADRLPAVVAKPWVFVAKKIGRPPVLSYASYALYNWRRLDPNKPIEIGNIVLLQNFLGGLDEEWFILVHVDIEAKAALGLRTMKYTHDAMKKSDDDQTLDHLKTMIDSLVAMNDTLNRMPESCDPYIYYNRVRPYIHGWKDNPALPNGLLYEGVEEYRGKPQFFKGETGAQSTIIPSYDIFLGITHENNPLKKHLDEMRLYMPPNHQRFLESLEKQPSLRKYIFEKTDRKNRFKKLYNDCVQLVTQFRHTHLSYAARYIQKQSQTSLANPTTIGTGGTPFMEYLRKHLTETEKFLL